MTNQWSKPTNDCLNKLNWPTLTSRRDYLSVLMMYDIMNNRYDSLKLSDFCTFNTSCTCAHSLSLVPPQSTINSFGHSFFVNAPFLWNTVPDFSFTLSSRNFRSAVYACL